MPLLPRPRWLLLSDIHFRSRDVERTRRTAGWIVSLARETDISRVVVCGDVLTARSMQPTAVISAAYRFLSDLSSSVPHVNVILGNHDLAYRRDYATTALEALNMSRLRPFITLHDEVRRENWDGRDVLVLPFREDQAELTAAVADIPLDEAAHTIAFAHLAINRAVTQRHVIRDDRGAVGYPIRYRGLTGPHYFRTLARTFTGHFHSHQTILQSDQQPSPAGFEDRLQGSITYLGSPLQLTWADLCDEDRGVVLLDPATLEHELIVNPYAVDYMTVQGSDVQDDTIDVSTVQGKHVMMLGRLTRFQYWTARDKLLSLGAQSVREQRSTPTVRDDSNSFAYQGLGASVPESDRGVAFQSAEPDDSLVEPTQPNLDEQNTSPEPDDLRSIRIHPVEYVPDFVRFSAAESMDEAKTIELGQRLIMASELTTTSDDNATYKTLLDPSYSVATQNDFQISTKQVFVARPRSIVISNFLGVRDECTINFDGDLGRGLTFVVGSNGSGKSTLIEAIVWCQFGRCIRKGLSVSDVVNDITGKDCMVSLSFSNGYTITRYRKHRTHGNRVIVSLHGLEQPQFEHGEARASQAALDELLGIDYEEFIKMVVLGHESAASFLSSTPAQRHDLIESTLGLSTLDKSADLSRRMLREIDDDTATLRNRINTVEQAMSLIKDRISNRENELQRLHKEKDKAREAISLMQKDFGLGQIGGDDPTGRRGLQALEEDLDALSTRLEELKSKIKGSRQEVDQAKSNLRSMEIQMRREAAAEQPASNLSIHQTKSQHQAPREEPLTSNIQQLDAGATEHIHLFEPTLQHVTATISRLQNDALGAIDSLKLGSPANQLALHFIRTSFLLSEQLSRYINSLLDYLSSLPPRQHQEHADETKSLVEQTPTNSSTTESNRIKPINKPDESHTAAAPDSALNKQALSKQAPDSPSNNSLSVNLQEARQRLSSLLNHLSELLEQQGVLQDRQAKCQREIININKEVQKRAALQNKLAEKEREIAIYEKFMMEETSTLEKQRSSHTSITAEMESLQSTREPFAFWEESLSRRRTKSVTAATFRGYVLDKSIQELNLLASDILLVLYENTRHARELTKGMLRTIIAADPDYDQDSESRQNIGLLDQTLGVSKELSYAKRSGGERKRIDLAVFFALVQILQAHSRHRARYILIDEAFDSLDAAGQAAVVRWCMQLMARTDFQLVATHSEYLISSARGSSNDEDSDDIRSQSSVLSAVMTEEGTKYSHAMV
ncbi:P-loop containing nucleoside triphosphate hydrolase protein [Nemania sp. NC0429]|nr:P-loop containing nucleoside triphosphate hydrolase protein [Nemania sp. NC0429]